MDIAEYLNHSTGNLINIEDLRIAFRLCLGAIIWIHQTRPDVGCLIAKIATGITGARQSLPNATHFAML